MDEKTMGAVALGGWMMAIGLSVSLIIIAKISLAWC